MTLLSPNASAHTEPPVHDRGLQLHLFGAGRAHAGERSIIFRGHPKMWPLLAFMALRDGVPVEREEAAAALWPEVPDTVARGNLRRHLSYLNDALGTCGGKPWLLRSATQIGFAAENPIWTDVHAFVAASIDDTRLAEAEGLYAGELLSGLGDDWIVAERERLRDRYIYTLGRLVALERRVGNAAAAMHYASKALRTDPFREDLVRAVMRLRFETGDRAGALREFDRFAALVRRELDAEPAPETLRLSLALRTNERVVPEPPSLPLEENSFVGRGHELAQLDELVADARVVTIVGAPGVGKTRLALHFAHLAQGRFRDGARFIDLSHATGADSIARAIEDAFERRAQGRGEGSAPIEQRLRNKQLLIVLDNCEHVVEACSALASRIVRMAEDVRILATSQIVLNAKGEAVFRLDPLEAGDAGALFLDRARFARRGFSAASIDAPDLTAVVRATDGLPLALELCAARLRTLSLGELVARLERPLALFGGLRASLESSYVLLREPDRRLFRRFAVFAGAATIDAVRAVALDGADEAVALESLSRLVDHSLIVAPSVEAPEQRYAMLQPVLDFAREKLEHDPDGPAAIAVHARYFGRRYAAQNDVLRGARAHGMFDVVAREHDDLLAALSQLIDRQADPELGARLALALSRFWFDRGFVALGAAWFEKLVAAGTLSAGLRAQVLHCLATLIRNQGNYERAFALFGEALAALRECGDAPAIGKALATYSNAARMTGRYDFALQLAAEACSVFEAANDRYLCAYAHLTSGCAAFSSGDLGAARDFFARALAGYRSSGAAADIALALGNLGLVAFYENDLTAAGLLCTESAERAKELGNVYFLASASLTLARIAALRAETSRARSVLLETVPSAQAIDDKELLIGCVELAAWLCVDDDPLRGATFVGAVDAAREHYHIPRSPLEAAEHARLEAALAARLPADAYASAKRTGRTLALDETVTRVV